MLNKKDKDLRKNASGCNDPTAYEVLKNWRMKKNAFINCYIRSFIFAN